MMSQPAEPSALPSDLKKLSVDERIHLIETLWESIVDEQEALEVTKPQREDVWALRRIPAESVALRGVPRLLTRGGTALTSERNTGSRMA